MTDKKNSEWVCPVCECDEHECSCLVVDYLGSIAGSLKEIAKELIQKHG